MSNDKVNFGSYKYLKTTGGLIVFEYEKNNKHQFINRGDNTIRFDIEGWTYYED